MIENRATSPSDLTQAQVDARNPCPVHHDFKSIAEFKEFLTVRCSFDKTLANLLIGALSKAAAAGGHGDAIVGKDVRATDFYDNLSTYFFRNGFDAARFDDAMKQVAPNGIGPHEIASLVRALKFEQPNAKTIDVIRTLFEYAAIRYASAGNTKLATQDLRDLFTDAKFTARFRDASIKKSTLGVVGGFVAAGSFYIMQNVIHALGGGYEPKKLVAPALIGANVALEGTAPAKCPLGHTA